MGRTMHLIIVILICMGLIHLHVWISEAEGIKSLKPGDANYGYKLYNDFIVKWFNALLVAIYGLSGLVLYVSIELFNKEQDEGKARPSDFLLNLAVLSTRVIAANSLLIFATFLIKSIAAGGLEFLANKVPN